MACQRRQTPSPVREWAGVRGEDSQDEHAIEARPGRALSGRTCSLTLSLSRTGEGTRGSASKRAAQS
ncbi:hypothetical protein JCM16408A_34480 [Methylobacterium phyllosphaerae]